MYTLTYDANGKLISVNAYHFAVDKLAPNEFVATAEQYNNPAFWMPSGTGLISTADAAAQLLQQARIAKLDEANSKAQALADQLTAGYPEFERATWRDQKVEALAWDADNTKPTPYIDALALQRGIDRVLYLQKTVAKVTTYQDTAQKLVGQRQKYVDQITAITVGPAPGYPDEASAKAALDAIVINYVLS